MKKTIRLFTLLALTIFLVACGTETESTRTFESNQNGVFSTIVYTVEGDKVTKQTAENVINYQTIGLVSKEDAQEQLDPISESFQNIEGITHSIKYDDTEAVESMAVDYQVVDFDQIQNLPGMNFDEGVKEKGVSMKKSADLLEESGYVEVE